MGIIARRQTWHNGHDLHERKVSASSWINDKVLQQYGRVCDQNSAHITFDAKSTGAGPYGFGTLWVGGGLYIFMQS